MRNRRTTEALLLLHLLILAASGCATSRPDLSGAWQCVEPAPTQGDASAMKIITDGRFAFGRQSADGAIAYAGGGTCRQEDGKYIETVAYHWLPTLVGTTITFDCALKDGLWYHKARFEAGGEWFDIDEVWRRVAETFPRD